MQRPSPDSAALERLAAVMAGGTVSPPATALTFVDPALLEQVVGTAAPPAETLSTACSLLGVDAAFVPADAPWAERAVELLLAEDRVPIWAVDGLLGHAIGRLGLRETLHAAARDPAPLHGAFDERLPRAIAAIERGLELGVTAVLICDDLAGSAGPMLAPETVGAFLTRGLASMVAAIARDGAWPWLHSDGDVRPLLPAVASAGFTALHGGGGLSSERFEELYWAARREGLALIGGLASVELGAGPHAAVRLGHRAGLLAEAGGLVVADDGGVHDAAQVADLVTALAAAAGG
jgi:hypothetical protein